MNLKTYKMKTEKIQIGFDNEGAHRFTRNCNNKIKILDQAINTFKTITDSTPENLEKFENSFCDYAVEYIKNKHPEGLNLGLTDSQYIKLYDYDLTALKTIETNYKDIPGALKVVNDSFVENTPDFNIYAETEMELQRLTDCNNLINHMTEFHSKYMTEYGNMISAKLTPRFIKFNGLLQLEPNIDFIKKP